MGIPSVVFVLVNICGVCLVLGYFWRAYLKRKRDHPFADRDDVEVVFRERRVSGNSGKSTFTKICGARHCLTVTVTATELWVYGPDLFAAILEWGDLEHRIALGDIVGVEKVKKGVVEVSFDVGGGEIRRLRLVVEYPIALIEAIEAGRGSVD